MTILEIILSVSILSILVAYATTTYRLFNAHKYIAELFIERTVLMEMIDSFQSNPNLELEDEMVHKENFIKFLSDSREDAFTYIEKSQASIEEVLELIKTQPENETLNNIQSKLSELIDNERK